MAFLYTIPDDDIRRDFTHTALFLGVVPIYYNERTHALATRNGCPEWLLDIAEFIYQVFGDQERGVCITLTGEL